MVPVQEKVLRIRKQMATIIIWVSGKVFVDRPVYSLKSAFQGSPRHYIRIAGDPYDHGYLKEMPCLHSQALSRANKGPMVSLLYDMLYRYNPDRELLLLALACPLEQMVRPVQGSRIGAAHPWMWGMVPAYNPKIVCPDPEKMLRPNNMDHMSAFTSIVAGMMLVHHVNISPAGKSYWAAESMKKLSDSNLTGDPSEGYAKYTITDYPTVVYADH
jgi:hypothetical protein